jgi:multidrug efflux system membrane fusion protein
LRLVDIGNLVQASTATPLIVVTQIKPIYMTVTIPERDLGGSAKRWLSRPAVF